MNIIVCIKQVPAATSVSIDPVTSQLIREGVESVINPFDYHALEAALTLKEMFGASVTALTMGPAKAETALREALAMGCDRAVLLSDRAFAGSDTWATAYILKLAVERLGGADLIFCGRQAIDGDTAQVGPELAGQLDILQVAGVSELTTSDGRIFKIRRLLDDGSDFLQIRTPALLCVERSLNTPRVPTLKGYLRAEHAPVTVWSAADLQPDVSLIGLKGSRTKVAASHPAQMRRRKTETRSGAAAVPEILRFIKEYQA